MSRGGAVAGVAAVVFCAWVASVPVPAPSAAARPAPVVETPPAVSSASANSTDRGDLATLRLEDGTELEWERRPGALGRLRLTRAGGDAVAAGWQKNDEASGSDPALWGGDIHALLDGLTTGIAVDVRRGRQTLQLPAFFSARDEVESRPHAVTPLDRAAAIRVRGPRGEYDVVQDARGSLLVLNFWATWCGPCRAEMPVLQKVHRAYAGRGVRVVGVNMDENSVDLGRFLRDMGITYLTVRTGTMSDRVGRAWGVEGIPFTVIVRPDGRVAHVETGFRSEGYEERLTATLETLLKPAGRLAYIVH